MRTYGVIALSLALAAGCGVPAQKLAGGINRAPLASNQAAQHDQLVTEGDALWQQRADRAKLEAAIDKWDQAVKIQDDDWKTYEKLTHATYLLADGWMSFDIDQPGGKDAFLAMHERGFAYGQRGMAAISKDFEKRMRAGTKIEDAAKVLGRNAVPLLYWAASNLGKWAKAKGFTTVLENKDRIFSLVSRVYELGPDYFYGAADRYFGSFYCVAPAFAGGDVHKAYQHFQASLKAAPNYLGTYVLIAELYTPKQTADKDADPDAFDANLDIVLNAQPCPEGTASMQPCIMKGLEPEAEIEKRKARDLKAKKDNFF